MDERPMTVHGGSRLEQWRSAIIMFFGRAKRAGYDVTDTSKNRIIAAAAPEQNLMPDPFQGFPFDAANATHMRVQAGLTAAAQRLSSSAIATTDPGGYAMCGPGDLLTRGEHVKLVMGQYQALIVAAERILFGTSWEEIARRRGLTAEIAEARFQPLVDQLECGETERIQWSPVEAIGVPQLRIPVAGAALRKLVDDQRRLTGELLALQGPVTSGEWRTHR